MTTLFFDTETTGKADFWLPPDDPCQPRLVQLGAQLYEGRQVIAEVNVLVKPEGFTIPADATRIHGITTEMALKHGIPVRTALSLLHHLALAAEECVAFNIEYDALVLRGEFLRAGRQAQKPLACGLDTRVLHCAMKAATEICQLPGKRPGEYKWPKLIEAHRHICGADFDKAHDALADVRATVRVWFAMGEMSVPPK